MFSCEFCEISKNTFLHALLALISPAINGVIFGEMTLKGPALFICLWEFDREDLKNNANKGRCNKGQQGRTHLVAASVIWVFI